MIECQATRYVCYEMCIQVQNSVTCMALRSNHLLVLLFTLYDQQAQLWGLAWDLSLGSNQALIRGVAHFTIFSFILHESRMAQR